MVLISRMLTKFSLSFPYFWKMFYKAIFIRKIFYNLDHIQVFLFLGIAFYLICGIITDEHLKILNPLNAIYILLVFVLINFCEGEWF
jgi:hypothetical protein